MEALVHQKEKTFGINFSKANTKCCLSLHYNTNNNGYLLFIFVLFLFFFQLDFLSQAFTNYRTAGEGRGYFFNSSLLPPHASQTLRHQLGDYCRELTPAHRQDSNREPLVSQRKRLLMENKYLNLRPTIKMLTFQLNFVWKVFIMDLVILSLEKYL